ncbi:MAG TPA: DUF72 domain-containing protein [Dongiaceae bacterium]|nr:DUF72 domain-containing protein [Dongiaceae bacterium]
MAKSGIVRVGISGWTYAPWRGVFYPGGLAQRRELSYTASKFPAIEINGTFYGLQRPEHFARWKEATPDDFVFAVKGPRFITHMRKLRDVETPLANFFASGLLRLDAKLGPILWQFSPAMRFDPGLFRAFFDQLPTDTTAAIALARQHDTRLDRRDWLRSEAKQAVRHAVEIRNESFCCAEFIKLLRAYKIALVCADTVKWPLLMDLTGDFVYCRLHGSKELYVSGYGPKALDRWARRIEAWARGGEPDDATRVLPPTKPLKRGRDVFVFFDNDVKVRAPADAAALAKRLVR